MNNDNPFPKAALGAPGEYEMTSEHERRQRIRNERMRKWRKQTRHPRSSELDDAAQMTLPRRFPP